MSTQRRARLKVDPDMERLSFDLGITDEPDLITSDELYTPEAESRSMLDEIANEVEIDREDLGLLNSLDRPIDDDELITDTAEPVGDTFDQFVDPVFAAAASSSTYVDTFSDVKQVEPTNSAEIQNVFSIPNLVESKSIGMVPLAPIQDSVRSMLDQARVGAETARETIQETKADIKTFYESTRDIREMMQSIKPGDVAQTPSIVKRLARELMVTASSSLASKPGIVNQISAVLSHPDLTYKQQIKYIANYLIQMFPSVSIEYVKSVVNTARQSFMRAVYGKWSVAQTGALVVLITLNHFDAISNWGLLISALEVMGIWLMPSIFLDLLSKAVTNAGFTVSKTILKLLPSLWNNRDPQIRRLRNAIENVRIPEQSVRRAIKTVTNINTLTQVYGAAQILATVGGTLGLGVLSGTAAASAAAVGTVWIGARAITSKNFVRNLTQEAVVYGSTLASSASRFVRPTPKRPQVQPQQAQSQQAQSQQAQSQQAQSQEAQSQQAQSQVEPITPKQREEAMIRLAQEIVGEQESIHAQVSDLEYEAIVKDTVKDTVQDTVKNTATQQEAIKVDVKPEPPQPPSSSSSSSMLYETKTAYDDLQVQIEKMWQGRQNQQQQQQQAPQVSGDEKQSIESSVPIPMMRAPLDPVIPYTDHVPLDTTQLSQRIVGGAQSILMQDVMQRATLLFPVQSEEIERAMDPATSAMRVDEKQQQQQPRTSAQDLMMLSQSVAVTNFAESAQQLGQILSSDVQRAKQVAVNWIATMLPYVGTYAAGGARSLIVQCLIQHGLRRIPGLMQDSAQLEREAQLMMERGEHLRRTSRWNVLVRKIIRGLQGGDYYTWAQWQQMSDNQVEQMASKYGITTSSESMNFDQKEAFRQRLFVQQHSMYLAKRQELLMTVASALTSNLLSQWLEAKGPDDDKDVKGNEPPTTPVVEPAPRAPTPPLENPTLDEMAQVERDNLARTIETSLTPDAFPFLTANELEQYRRAMLQAVRVADDKSYQLAKTVWTNRLQLQLETWSQWLTQLDVHENPLSHASMMAELKTLIGAVAINPFGDNVLSRISLMHRFVVPSYIGRRLQSIQRTIDQIPLSMRGNLALFSGVTPIDTRVREFTKLFGADAAASVATPSNIQWIADVERDLGSMATAWWKNLAQTYDPQSPLMTEWKRLGLSWRLQPLLKTWTDSASDLATFSQIGLANMFSFLTSQQVQLENTIAAAKPIIETNMSLFTRLQAPGVKLEPPKTLSMPTDTWAEYAKVAIPDDTELEGTKMVPLLYTGLGQYLVSVGAKTVVKGAAWAAPKMATKVGQLGRSITVPEYKLTAVTDAYDMPSIDLERTGASVSLIDLLPNIDPTMALPWMKSIKLLGRGAEFAQAGRVVGMITRRGLDRFGRAAAASSATSSADVDVKMSDASVFTQAFSQMPDFLFPTDASSIVTNLDRLDKLSTINTVVDQVSLSGLLAKVAGRVQQVLRDTSHVEFEPGKVMTELSRQALIENWSSEELTRRMLDVFIGGSKVAEDVKSSLSSVSSQIMSKFT